jgi:hypothetical protein
MKRITAFILALAVALLIPCSAFAEGSGNMDGGGGDMEGGTKSNFWHAGEDGVRVTVVRSKDAKPVSIPIDLTNWNENYIKKHFGKKSKLHYRNGNTLRMTATKYIYTNPSKPLPKVISNGGNANIAVIKRYFCSAETIKKIASIIGASYETLINGNYKLLIEPIAYFTFNGTKMAMTATEAALYDQKLSGGLRRKMVSLSHQNLPLSLFLEKSDLGYPAYHGSTSRAQSNSTIISSLGLGIVKFKEEPPVPPTPPQDETSKSTYRVDTDVITSVTLSSGSSITPESPAKVSFRINGSTYNVTNIVIPENESQLVWVKWHTPKKPQTVNISISSSKGSLNVNKIAAKIETLDENPPPDPTAKDRNDRFTIPNIPKRTERTASSWGIWNAKWVPDWQWHEKWVWKENSDLPSGGKWVDKGKWVDEGEWEYKFKSYHASLKSNMKLLPDDKVPTAKGKLMRSGYGIKINVNSSIRSSAPTSHYTCGQTAVTYFPEFSYNTYWRLLDLKRDGDTSSFSFKNNIYSTYNRKVHFTPLWFPNKKYTAYTYLQDAWTPAGMLSMNLTDYVNIDGSVFDDWHVGPKLTE